MAQQQLPLTTIAYLNLVDQGVGHIRALTKAARAVEPVVLLALDFQLRDRWPTQAEYADHAGISERTAVRQWEYFKEAFPDEDSPLRFAKLLNNEYGKRLDRKTVVVSPAPRELQPA